jgi:hypothetical protein
MTPVEAATAYREFLKSVGPDANIYVSLNVGIFEARKGTLHAMLYPAGICHSSGYVSADADTFEDLLAAIGSVWAESADRNRAERVRKMALEIIRITAEQGACTDAALRADEFTADEVSRYSEAAIADANEIASNGPFSIVRLAGANAA